MKVHVKASRRAVEEATLPTYQEFIAAFYEREVNNNSGPMDALFGKVKAAKLRASKVTPKGKE